MSCYGRRVIDGTHHKSADVGRRFKGSLDGPRQKKPRLGFSATAWLEYAVSKNGKNFSEGTRTELNAMTLELD